MKWLSIGYNWHILIEPSPHLLAGQTICGFNPPTLVARDYGQTKEPPRKDQCPACLMGRELGKIAQWVAA